MSNSNKEAASKAINKTITIVEDALGIDVPRSSVPSISRATMVEMLKAGFRTPLAGCWCSQYMGWGSQVVRPNGANCSPEWVGTPDAYIDGNYRWKAMTPEFEKMLDEVAEHLSKGRLVDWGGKGWSDKSIRKTLIGLDKWYRKQNPSFKKIRWDAQPPVDWEVFYVEGTSDINDSHTMGRVARVLRVGRRRIIDISGSVPVDLTDAYKSAVGKRRRASVARDKPARTRQDAGKFSLRSFSQGKTTRTRQDASDERAKRGGNARGSAGVLRRSRKRR